MGNMIYVRTCLCEEIDHRVLVHSEVEETRGQD